MQEEEKKLPRSRGILRQERGLALPITNPEEVEGKWIFWEKEFRQIVGLWDQEKDPGYVKTTSETHNGLTFVSIQDPDVELLSNRASELLSKGITNLHLRELEELEGELR